MTEYEEPCEELNVELAIALGWEKVLIPDGTPCGESDDYWCSGAGNNRQIHQRIEYWHPSDELDGAFQVIDAMKEKGFWCYLKISPLGFKRAVFHNANDTISTMEHSNDGTQLPFAICKAALSALAALEKTK